jgi:polyferredoxin
MLGSMAVALMLQTTVSKRVWCATVCPYGNLLDQTMKAVKKR